MSSESALDIAADVRAGRRTAIDFAERSLARIRERDGAIGAITRVLADRALDEARAVDAIVAGGGDPGPLAGVPYAVKDLFDVAGLATTAGAGMLRDAPPATCDAEAIVRMRAAGAVLVATCNMDEYAYGFATINATFGTTKNPCDISRLAGGSSGGSAAAVAAGMVPVALGSDTNGSIRVPAALCGLYGYKPAHGSLPMAGVYPFVDSFDDIGPFAGSIDELSAVCTVLAGSTFSIENEKKIARLTDWFADNLSDEMQGALAVFGSLPELSLPNVEQARSAAFLMTAAEGGRRHLPELRCRAMAFDPATRDRLIAGAMLPAAHYLAALEVRERFRATVERVFETYDVLVAPCVGEVAPTIADPVVTVDGERVPARAHLGRLTQPISFIGLPVIAAPLSLPNGLPLGVQLIGWPGREGALFAYAKRLERDGVIGSVPVF
ncbi:AtzE family amidohydrolase [Sphingomonas aliaeris]|uniref:AtzE family amidohydrolase n=1 Tax=Sphingomonas aliaeris TaxID=2759526 RepID=A0A974NSR9_9SPHN|nr:AtzE family amidohydrolase [Sphingomonas aliaeris]QQV76216.1 AtzE family amidohydrolase [Sphingomonas aliaeris]